MFSARVPAELSLNVLATALDARTRQGRRFDDLTETNPTRAGLDYPRGLLAALSDEAGLLYAPDPRGLPAAREAVAAELTRHGLSQPLDRIVLTASTSEAYSWLFKLLCGPGDAVLVPAPSYPLFDHLAALESVEPVPYALEYHGRWSIDVAAVERLIHDRVRAVLVVSPNNPTGSYVTAGELEGLTNLCAAHDMALIGDEVFADYELTPGTRGPSVLSRAEALTFSLGGLSKSVGLPQVKLAWMAAAGPAALVDASLARLELIADTYLSVSTPVQLAAARLLQAGASVRTQIQERIASNYQVLSDAARRHPSMRLLAADGGWSAVIQVPAIRSEDDWVLLLLDRADLLVHPGYFFDFDREAFLVLSLLPPPALFAAAIDRLCHTLEGEPTP